MIKGFIKSILNRKLEITNGFKGNQGKILKKRVLAFTLDLALVIIISSGITFTLTSFVSPYLNLENNKNTLMNFNQYMIIFHVWMTSITLLSYHFISYLLGNGATPGKMLFKLKILPLAVDQKLNISQCFLRSVSYVFLYWGGQLFLGLPFFIKGGVGIPDWISNTQVVCTKKQVFNELNEESQLLLLNRSSHL
ncbi:MAG: hypothetical protein HOJ35_02495 [Bdellovibrionales bacterium]|jgi:uncharacterized RDD family membrane protein YckC|nr:hypothetical protein [Bdellovibrionales bacterium]